MVSIQNLLYFITFCLDTFVSILTLSLNHYAYLGTSIY